MNYREVIITFNKLDEHDLDYLSNIAINDFECLGTEELNLDFSKSDLEDWQLQSAKEDISELSEKSQKLKFFYDLQSKLYETLISHIKDNFDVQSVQVNEGNSNDWENEWKKYLQPIIVSDNLKITFITDEEASLEFKDSELYIYPGMGFGTGGHETTFLCLGMMESILKKEEVSSCLDFGCGSGILGILASKKEVKTVDYYDIDEDALVNCRQNIKVNKLNKNTSQITVHKNDLQKTYDLVLANILLHVLIAEKEDIMNSASKHLVLSGLLKTQEEEILIEYLSDEKFVVKDIQYKNEWMAIHLERKS